MCMGILFKLALDHLLWLNARSIEMGFQSKVENYNKHVVFYLRFSESLCWKNKNLNVVMFLLQLRQM